MKPQGAVTARKASGPVRGVSFDYSVFRSWRIRLVDYGSCPENSRGLKTPAGSNPASAATWQGRLEA